MEEQGGLRGLGPTTFLAEGVCPTPHFPAENRIITMKKKLNATTCFHSSGLVMADSHFELCSSIYGCKVCFTMIAIFCMFFVSSWLFNIMKWMLKLLFQIKKYKLDFHQLFVIHASTVSWSTVIHKDESRPVLLLQGYDNGINDVTELVLDCHNAIHFVEISSEAIRLDFHTITPTIPRWPSGDLAIGV